MAAMRCTRLLPGRRGLLLWVLTCLSALLAVQFPSIFLNYQLAEVRRTLRAGDATRAVAALNQLAGRCAESGEWHYLLARSLRRTGNLTEASKQLELAEELGWNAADIQREQLLNKARRGQVKKVEPQLVELLASGVGDEAAEDIYEAMSQGYWASYYVGDALECLEFWSSWQPDNLVPRLWIADLYRRSDQPNAAAEAYRKILELDPKHPEALVKLGDLYLKKLAVDEASDAFEQCMAASPDSADALLGLAECRRRKGLTEEVRQLVSETLTLDLNPIQAARALGILGAIALEDRNYSRAIRLLQASVRIDANDPGPHESLAAALTAVGQDEVAAVERQRAHDTSQRHARLMRITSKALEEPQNADLRCEAGLILMEQGFWSEGADWIKTAIEIDPQHRAAHEAMAKYFERLGDAKQARRHRRLAEHAARAAPAADKKAS